MSSEFDKMQLLLIKAVRQLNNSREWLNQYFDLVKELLDFAGLKEDDARLSMTLPQSGIMPVNIGQRYIIKPDINTIGLIMPASFDAINCTTDSIKSEDKNFFFRRGIQEAKWITFEMQHTVKLSQNVKKLWLETAMEEVNKCKVSGYRKYHQYAAYYMATDTAFREEILDLVFDS